MFPDYIWYEVKDGDKRALALMRRHYSWRIYRDNRPRNLFIGPGEKMALLTANCDALFVWRKFIDDSGQEGVNCAAFRNESEYKASFLIEKAMEEFAFVRWPGERLYTYVDPKKIRKTRQPGRCFIKAGWRVCGKSKGGLIILEYVVSSTPAQ